MVCPKSHPFDFHFDPGLNGGAGAGRWAEKKKRTLTNLYNTRPTWLELAHKKLDEAVFAAYGWPDDLSDDDIAKERLSEKPGTLVTHAKICAGSDG